MGEWGGGEGGGEGEGEGGGNAEVTKPEIETSISINSVLKQVSQPS